MFYTMSYQSYWVYTYGCCSTKFLLLHSTCEISIERIRCTHAKRKMPGALYCLLRWARTLNTYINGAEYEGLNLFRSRLNIIV